MLLIPVQGSGRWRLEEALREEVESPNFLEMELPDDEEDDEDFNPDRVSVSGSL